MTQEGTSLKRGIVALAIGAIAALTLSACGGGGDDPDPTATTGSGSTGTSSTPASGTTPSTSATSSSGSTGGTITRASIASLNSYKYSIKMSGTGGPLEDITGELSGLGGSNSNLSFEIAGAYIRPDKAQTSIKFGDLETSTVIVGNQQWSTFGGMTSGPTPATATDVADANFLADFWTDDDLGSAIKEFKCGNKENVNGVSATKCTLDKAGFEKQAAETDGFLGNIDVSTLSTANVDVWIADAGHPVRMRMDVAGKDADSQDFNFKVEMEVTEVNGNFQIEAPKT